MLDVPYRLIPTDHLQISKSFKDTCRENWGTISACDNSVNLVLVLRTDEHMERNSKT